MEKGFKNAKSAVLWLCLAHLACDVYGGFLNPIMPFIAAKLGFSMAVATVIISISHICSSMMQPVFGFFADNILKRFFIFWHFYISLLSVSIYNILQHISCKFICCIPVFISKIFVFINNI